MDIAVETIEETDMEITATEVAINRLYIKKAAGHIDQRLFLCLYLCNY